MTGVATRGRFYSPVAQDSTRCPPEPPTGGIYRGSQGETPPSHMDYELAVSVGILLGGLAADARFIPVIDVDHLGLGAPLVPEPIGLYESCVRTSCWLRKCQSASCFDGGGA